MPQKKVCVDDFIVTLKVTTERFEEPKCPTFRTFNGGGPTKKNLKGGGPKCCKCKKAKRRKPCPDPHHPCLC